MIVILLSVLSLLGISGYYAYQNFSTIISSFSEESKPDLYLVKLKSVLNEVNNAENAAKTYRLTEDEAELLQFYSYVERTDSSINSLYEYTNDEARQKSIDSLSRLIEQKFIFLQVFNSSSQIYRGPEALDKVLEELNTKRPRARKAAESEDSRSRARRFIDRLLNKETEESDEKIVQQSGIDQDVIDQEIEEAKSEELLLEEMAKAADNALLLKIDSFGNMISSIAQRMESQENAKLLNETEKADLAMKDTNQNLFYFFILIGLIIIFMSYLIFNNLRQNRLYRNTLQQAKQLAEDHAADRERFFASMSHELRTPLNAIQGFSEQIETDKLTSDTKEKLGMISNASDHLLKLVNELLDHSKLQANKLKLESEYFSIAQALEDCINISQSLVNDKQTLEFDCSFSKDQMVLGDEKRLKQIILNLLSNAIKFTPEGKISLSAQLQKIEGEPVSLSCTISDEGIGMSYEQAQKVFGEYEQIDNNISHPYGGTGLGLTIVKQLVELHGGSIKVESEEGKGSSFSLVLKYEDLKEEKNTETKKESTPIKFKKVLVADDELYNRKLIGNILSKLKMDHDFAINGKEVLQKLEQEEFDLLLLDIRMPVMNGIETLAAIRRSNDIMIRSTPCIAISAALTEQETDQLNRLKVNGIIIKPFKEKELLRKMNDLGLDSQEYTSKRTAKEEAQDEPINFSNLQELSGGNSAFYIDMIETFKNNMSEGLTTLKTLEKEKNYGMIAEHAHRLCSPCRHLKCYDLLDHLKELEAKARSENQKDVKAFIEQVEQEYLKIEPLVIAELEGAKS